MRDYLSFVLNGEPQKVRGLDPARTLLEYLRRERRLTGTKEGCAEGDCGACTVTVGELAPELGPGIRHRALNACILPMPMLEGRSVTTVEGLRGRDGGLHPVQQAMVDTHGSQCGFCTPGFVMSLYAAYLSEPRPRTARIDDLLAGNLCRCTGYGPIVKAAQAMYDRPCPPHEAEARAAKVAQLRAVAHDKTIVLDGAGSRFYGPAALGELARLCEAHPDATILSGATDVGLWITKQHRRIATFVCTGRVRELHGVHREGSTLRIGAGVRLADLQETIGRHYRDFAELLRRFGSVQVRNAATVGGNIANGSPVGDGPPALIALGARLALRHGAARRTMPLEAFFLAYGKQDRRPGELVEAVEVPLIDRPERLECLQGEQALRPGHLGRVRVLQHRRCGRHCARGAHRIRRHGRHAEAGHLCRGGAGRAALGARYRHGRAARIRAGLHADRRHARVGRLSHAGRQEACSSSISHETERPLRESRLVGHAAAFS